MLGDNGVSMFHDEQGTQHIPLINLAINSYQMLYAHLVKIFYIFSIPIVVRPNNTMACKVITPRRTRNKVGGFPFVGN